MSQSTGFSPETDDPTVRLIASLPKVRGYPVIGQYILCSQLGAGGAGAVFMGYHVKLQRQVAIKVLNPAVLDLSDKAVARFEREAILTSQVRSNHIIPVTDAGTVPGTQIHYLVMDLIDGENAEDRVARRGGMLGVSEALTIIRDATRGLADAHRLEIIHRDLKPANIMISAAGEVRLADLGIATSFEKPNLMYTQQDEFLGTPQYMSPEQIRGDVLDGRTDVYSMGVTLHHLLTGEHPFHGSTAYAVMQRVESESLPDIRQFRDDVPANVASFIQAATQRDREQRIPSSEAMASRLDVLLKKLGEVNLADPDAGGELRDRRIHIPSEKLQALLAEMNRAATTTRAGAAPPPRPRSRFRAAAVLLVLLLLVGGVGAAGYVAYQNGMFQPPAPTPAPAPAPAPAPVAAAKPLADQLQEAIAASDVPKIAAVMREISRNQGDSAQRTNFEAVALWLADDQAQDPRKPVAFLGQHAQDGTTILSLLKAAESETYAGWLKRDADALIQQGQWDGLEAFMVELNKTSALPQALSDQIASQVYDAMIGSIRSDGLDAVDEQDRRVMRYLADSGSEQFELPLALIEKAAASELTAALLEEWYALAQTLGLLDEMRGAILDAAAGLMQAPAADHARAIRLLEQVVADHAASATPVATMFTAYAESRIANLDWPMLTTTLQALRRVSPSDATGLTRLGESAVAAIAAAARYNPTGTVTIPGQSPDRLLQLLMELGITNAARWQVELAVTWDNGEDMMDLRVNMTSQQFGELLAQARSTADEQSLIRLLFIAYDHTRWIRVKAETLSRDEVRNNLFSNCTRAIPAGNPDSAARYIFDCHFAQSFIPDSQTIDYWPNAMKELGFDAPTWNQLVGNLSNAPGMNHPDRLKPPSYWLTCAQRLIGPSADRRDRAGYIDRRAQFWLAWGRIMMDPSFPDTDQQLRSQFERDPEPIRDLFEAMLIAAEWGYAPNKSAEVIRITRDHIEAYLPEGQKVLTKNQQFRLNRLERLYPR